MRLGVLIPEFPGQTHIFFWREIAALRELGVEPEIISTRRPPPGIVTHTWSQDAIRQTVYLAPPTPADIGAATTEIARSLPWGVLRAARSVTRARGVDARARARLAGLAVMGARLARLWRERRWAHVHVHSCADAAHVAMFANRLANVPYSVTLHGPLVDYGPNQCEKWRYARFAFVITRKLLAEVETDLAGCLPPVVDVAPMGVETRKFVRSRPYAPWTGSGPLRIFSCGRLNPCKGHGDLAKAVGILRSRGIDARLEIAGEDELGGVGFHRTLADEIAAADLGSVVTLLGAIPEERVVDRLQDAHVFSLASWAEPLGVAIMEAMALGAPVVATDAGGVPELVRHEQDGLLVPPVQPDALAGAIERIARDPSLARRLADSARQRVLSEFDSRRSAQLLVKYARG
jgi:glycosyltransferase involved in cell wall biosynthesis